VILQHVVKGAELQLSREPLALALVNVVAFAVAIGFALYLNRLPLRRAFPRRGISFGQLAGMGVTVLGAGILLSEADNFLRWILPPPTWFQELFGDVFVPENRLFSQIFLLVLVAPLTEELLFRGMILRGLLARYGPGVAVVLTALLFALIHLNPWQILPAFFLGVVFGWFYLRTGSVLLCVIAHAINNGLFLVMWLLPTEIPGLTGAPDPVNLEFQPLWLDTAGLALLLAGVWIFRKATPSTEVFDAHEPPVISTTQTESVPPPL
jgi:uncharacterized protein